ncbi:hypothetical protein [Nocardia mexicana]|uniref:Uncharacterized protein n=1 Tax=Nocardia mexicana TaxID=279262 RepID=A0A370H3L9_9NOCA|nr:hypothetical protein [Nocardia mexicana]RDI50815.1 hypothetical protein DFR68_105292 [Nocardia mexicana]
MDDAQRQVWEIRLGVYATEEQARHVVDQVTALLCPDPDHRPPCPIPWSVALLGDPELEEGELYADLIEQYRIEQYRIEHDREE